jgi:glycosyltransferase involved in cell wall biosynthesis
MARFAGNPSPAYGAGTGEPAGHARIPEGKESSSPAPESSVQEEKSFRWRDRRTRNARRKAKMNLLIPHGFEANYVVGFARGLAANGVPFTVISCDETAPRLTAAGIPNRNFRGNQDPSRPAWRKAVNLARYYVLLLWTTFRHRGGTFHFIGLLGSRIILLDGVVLPLWFRLWAGRYIHTAHNALPHSREKSRFFHLAYRWIYRFPHAIVAHTPQVARLLETKFGVQPGRITVISIGLNEEVPASALSVSEARRQLNLPAGPIALFFGKVEPYKGVDLLAEAWGMVRAPAAQLVIAGLCPDSEYAGKIRQAIAQSPRAASMRWQEGFVPNDVVAVWLRACDVVVLPYRHIYQSGVIFLCLRLGIPIVCTNVGSMSDYVDRGTGIVTATNDPAGIAAALDQYFAAPERFPREEISRRAAKFSWDRQCALIKHLYG